MIKPLNWVLWNASDNREYKQIMMDDKYAFLSVENVKET